MGVISMYVRNCLCTGDYLTVVPVGLPLTLQYSANGFLETVYEGYDPDRKDISSELLNTIRSANTLPTKIPITGGTTWVKGVLYTSETFISEGELPSAISDDLKSAYVDHPDTFNFFAGNVESLATVFRGAAPIRNWLSMTKFNVLPGWLITNSLTRDQFVKLINTTAFPFKFPLISSYIIYRGRETLFVSTHIKQFIIHKVERYLDDYGYIKCKLSNKSGSQSCCVSYTDVVRFNLQPKCLVVLDCYGNVIYSKNLSKKSNIVDSTTVCSVCGKSFSVPASGEVKCPDPHCMSSQYHDLVHLLNTFNLPVISKSIYDNYVAAGQLTCIPDVLQLPDYDEIESVPVSLGQLLSAIVPISIVADGSIFASIVNRCNNNIHSFRYYVHHSELITRDLGVSGMYVNRLVQWLQDPYNALDIDALLDNPKLSIVATNKRFNGAPIFRGKTIMITGEFQHGSSDDIVAILSSYAANVVTSFSENVHCVLTGGTLENIDGLAVRNARNLGIPVYDEFNFFKQYEIDKDLSENL